MNTFPLMYRARQNFPCQGLDAAQAAVEELARIGLAGRLKNGLRVGVTAGSRGISALVPVLKEICRLIREAGATPVVLAAMGSHGGGTPEGRLQVLSSLDVTPASIGAPVLGCSGQESLGKTAGGVEVYTVTEALACDGLIVLNRVKPHTSFHGHVESGLLKMLAVGLGGPAGARAIHAVAPDQLARSVLDAGRLALERLPVLAGLALVEDAREETVLVRAVLPGELEEVERKLLVMAREKMARLPFHQLDLLVVEEMGKCYSGTGMDTNIIGRLRIQGQPEPQDPRLSRLLVLDLAEASHGNANGVGLADFTTRTLAAKVDWSATYLNSLTAGFPMRSMLPVLGESDREAMEMAISSLPQGGRGARVARIANTLHLGELEFSETLLPEALEAGLEVVAGPAGMTFDAAGRLKRMEEEALC